MPRRIFSWRRRSLFFLGGPAGDRLENQKRRREARFIVLLTLFLIGGSYLAYRFTLGSGSLPFANSLFFFGLLNLNLLILLGLLWLIFRNISKLFLERQSRALGARLKSKLVVAFLGFSLTPTIVLFLVSSLYINSSFDQWFSLRIQNTLQSSLEITRTYYREVDESTRHFAEQIVSGMRAQRRTAKGLYDYLEKERSRFSLFSIEYYAEALGSRWITQDNTKGDFDENLPPLSMDFISQAIRDGSSTQIFHVESGDLIRTLTPVWMPNALLPSLVVVSSYLPIGLTNKVGEIANVFDDYRETNPLRYPLKGAYFVILLMITLVIVFVAIWLGLYLARQLTNPVEKLQLGVRQVGRGNLDYQIESSGSDEFATLIDAFNRMTVDLRAHRAQLEAILQNIGAGVLVLDSRGEILTLNPAIETLIGPKEAVERLLKEEQSSLSLFSQDALKKFSGSSNNFPLTAQWSQTSMPESGISARQLSMVATPLREGRDRLQGIILVIDDLTDITKTQREVAWREVARRIAHEIKNPLTPIKLSAQRLQRRLSSLDGEVGRLVNECTNVIVQHTDELKEMVNEFSNFARLPEMNSLPNRIESVLDELKALYSQAHPDLEIEVDVESDLPKFSFDRDQIKRVLVNLMENALQSYGDGVDTKRWIGLSVHSRETEIIVSVRDRGPGMTEEVKSRVFEPYFSTKSSGTGLGLAIAKRIISDHSGSIRVNSSVDQGTEFLISLPVRKAD